MQQFSLETQSFDKTEERMKVLRGFSEEGYRELLLAFKSAGYTFCSFEEIKRCLWERQP